MNSNLVLLVALSLLVALECAQSRPTDLVHANPEDVQSVTAKSPTAVPEQKKIVSKLSQPQEVNSASANNVNGNAPQATVSAKVVENSLKSESASSTTQPDIPNQRQGKCYGYKGVC